jgi:hypothetical protein
MKTRTLRTLTLLGLAATVLGACATADGRWTKPGMTINAFEQDTRECDREANVKARAEGRPGHQGAIVANPRDMAGSSAKMAQHHSEHEQVYGACMRARGYSEAR